MASRLYTRAEFRDRLRRKASIVPPIDISGIGGIAGQQPTNAPKPTNADLNDAFQDAISDINRECGFHITEGTYPVAAQSSSLRGPYVVYLGNLEPNTGVPFTPTGGILNVQRVVWIPTSTGLPILVKPAVRDNLDRGEASRYYSDLPTTPRSWYVQGYGLYIIPAQNEAGVYDVILGTGISGLVTDNDVLDQVPVDMQGVFEDRAMYRVAITMTGDVEWQERAQSYGALSLQGMKMLKENRQGDGASQPVLTFRGNRSTYGTRRLVR